MNREQGLEILRSGGWLSATPAEFQEAILSRCAWGRLEAGAPIQAGGEEAGDGARHCRNEDDSRTCGHADHAFRPSCLLVRLRPYPHRSAPTDRRQRQVARMARAHSSGHGQSASCRTAGMVAALDATL